jgi:DNA transformation protein and related proteins
VDPEYIRELFAAFGAVEVRRMFGGAGLYADGVMFGLVSDGRIYLKADAATAPDFEREGSARFEYDRNRKRAVMSYWRLPDRLYDDPDDLARWARAALSLAQRIAAANTARAKPARIRKSKRKRKRKRKKKDRAKEREK